MLDQRGQLLRAALGFAALPRPSYERALWALRTWLDSWSGIGRPHLAHVLVEPRSIGRRISHDLIEELLTAR